MWLQRFRHEVMTVGIRMVQLEWLIQEIHEVWQNFVIGRVDQVTELKDCGLLSQRQMRVK